MSDYYDEDDEPTPQEVAAYQQQMVAQAWQQAEDRFIDAVGRLQRQIGHELTNRELQILHVDWQRSPDPLQYSPAQAYDELFDPIDASNEEQHKERFVEYIKDAQKEAEAEDPMADPDEEPMWSQ